MQNAAASDVMTQEMRYAERKMKRTTALLTAAGSTSATLLLLKHYHSKS
jgi:hypothetical protein